MANLLFRTTITPPLPVSISAKAAPLSNTEIDGNFRSLNVTKFEASDASPDNVPGKLVIRDENGNFSIGTLTADVLIAQVFEGAASRVENALTPGDYITGDPFDGSEEVTWNLDATDEATPDKVVARDTNGDFAANVVTVVDLNTTSDQRLKTDIAPIVDALSVITQLSGKSYRLKATEKQSYGLIAQQLELILPALVSDQADGTKVVNYTPLIAFLIEAVKQQQEQIAQLQQHINK